MFAIKIIVQCARAVGVWRLCFVERAGSCSRSAVTRDPNAAPHTGEGAYSARPIGAGRALRPPWIGICLGRMKFSTWKTR